MKNTVHTNKHERNMYKGDKIRPIFMFLEQNYIGQCAVSTLLSNTNYISDCSFTTSYIKQRE